MSVSKYTDLNIRQKMHVHVLCKVFLHAVLKYMYMYMYMMYMYMMYMYMYIVHVQYMYK